MKIKLSFLLVMLGLVLCGCARVPARAGDSRPALAGRLQVPGNSSDMFDYRRVLANPGPF